MKYRILLFLSLFLCPNVYGQLNPYDYNADESRYPDDPLSFEGEELFRVPLKTKVDIFDRMARYNFSAVKHTVRGYQTRVDRSFVSNIEITPLLSQYQDYSLLANLRQSRLRNENSRGITSGGLSGVGEMEWFSAITSTMPDTKRVALSLSNRKSRYRARFAGAEFGEGWGVGLVGSMATGRDADIDGVFNSEANLLLSGEYCLTDGHTLYGVFSGGISQSGGRSYTTQRAFDLAGDNLYNPSWGYYDGDVRNSKVYDKCRPFTMVSYEGQLSDATTLTASVAYRFGKSSYSALGWSNAEVPYPDYYSKLESPHLSDAWAYGDTDITQINWAQMYDANQNTPNAVYWLEKRVEDTRDLQLAVSARSVVGDDLVFDYGVRMRTENTSFYKEMKDLLGGRTIFDRDPFVETQDGVEKRNVYNNVRNPQRLIGKDDKFGHNYTLSAKRQEGFVAAAYSGTDFGISGGLEIGKTSMQRDGKYEKEIYAGAKSYGKSRKAEFDTYALNLSFGYYISPRQSIRLAGYAGASAPEYGAVFLSPQSTNMLAGAPEVYKTYSLESAYRLTSGPLDFGVSLYHTKISGHSSVSYYYDELAAEKCYSDMLVTGADMTYTGVELAASYEITNRFRASAIAAYMRNRYASDAAVTILDDVSKVAYVEKATSNIDGFRVGGSPELLASVELEYNARNWIVSMSCNYMGERYLTPTPLRRMERAYGKVATDNAFRNFVGQEKLDDACTVDMFILKSFEISGRWLTATLSVKNLLGSKDIVYNGYEQNRVRNYDNGAAAVYRPFDSKYLYSYPRSYYLSLSYRF